MKKLIPCILALLLLIGCSTSHSPATVPHHTQPRPTMLLPENTMPPEPSLPTESTVPPDPLSLFMERLTTEQKVGQLFIASPAQILPDTTVTSMSDELAAALEDYPLGGIVLFSENIHNPEQVTALNRALAVTGVIPPFIAVDEEGGQVARLADNHAFGLPTYESAAAVGADGDPSDALAMGRTIGAYLHSYGFNLNFAPVADINTNPNNPVIGDRAFSSDPLTAAQMTAAFAAGLRENHVCATFKHFPGHGDTDQDSHYGLAVSHRSRQELAFREWIPFQQATPVDLIMTAHVALPQITGDMDPATLSHEIVTGVLRNDLGFEGLIITDAMNMGAIADNYSSGEAAVAALQAGCDIVLMPEDAGEAFDAVLSALQEGRLTEEWLDATVRRILAFKQAHGILTLS